MTIVLVHGNLGTEAIWDDLVPHLRNDDVVRLSPPGFGCAIPSGFDCSAEACRDWLAGELYSASLIGFKPLFDGHIGH